ncbi:hypothetical protein V7068_14725 [Bacillus sp. JJ634]
MSQEFFDLVQLFEERYFCDDLEFRYIDINEITETKRKLHQKDEEETEILKKSTEKRRFDHEELKFEEGQKENLENGFLNIPKFYEEPVDLPLYGTKYIRSYVEYYAGDLAKVVCEIGYWRLKPNDLQHRDYVSTKKNAIYISYYHEEKRWSLLSKDVWEKRREELERDLDNPLLRAIESEFYDVLMKTIDNRKLYYEHELRDEAEAFVYDLKDLGWYIENVPLLWASMKLYNKEMYHKILDRMDEVYKGSLPELERYIDSYPYEDAYPNFLPHSEESKKLENDTYLLLASGFEVVGGRVFPNLQRMYKERQETNYYANVDELNGYKEIAKLLHEENKKKKGKDADTFVEFKEVKTVYDSKKHTNNKRN